MGFSEYISSATDSLKRNAPDIGSLKGLCWSTYDHSCSAVTEIHRAVTGNPIVQEVYQQLLDEETRSQIAINLAKHSAGVAVQEGLKFVPGGSTVYTIVSRSFHIDKMSKQYKELLELKNKVDRLDKELSDCKKLLEATEIRKPTMGHNCALDLNQKPEDVIRIFMMREFMGKHFLDDLIVPGVRSKKRSK